MRAGELLLLDVGAKLHGYSADISRTIPLSGKFDERQRELYELVVTAHDRAAAVLKPGATIRDAQRAAREVFEEHDLAQYFLHSVGHHLGLRVHDVPGFRGELAEGMVVTIEPGLYLAEEAIGIRIENDFRITAEGAELLSGAVPYHTEALEAYLARIRGEG
jgi:Xaa-Pro aminopeptidase